jgi:sulfate/thiosulfate-binding protein
MRRVLLLSLLIPVFAFTGVASASGVNLNLVAFSTPKPVMDTIIPKFQATAAGKGVTFSPSYGPSGSQAKAIVAGQPADIAFLSNALDIDYLVNNNLVVQNWGKVLPQGGMVADSVVAFVVRPGNPKGIHGWSDLVKTGVQIVTPDPFPSGGAKWNVLAAYGAQRKLGKTDKKATTWVQKMFGNVVQQDTSSSAAMQTFLNGKGDVLLTYESEAYTALLANKAVKIVIPRQTMKIQLPMVPLKSAPPEATAFIKYCHSKAAQTVFTKAGYRPVVKSVLKQSSLAQWRKRFATGNHVFFGIHNPIFGGWPKANSVWFSQNGRMEKIEQAIGGPTS